PDEAEPHVAELQRVTRLEEAAAHLLAVDADAVRAALVDDLVAPAPDGRDVRVQPADGAVVDRDRRLFGAPDAEVLLRERELLAGLRADDDDQPIGALVGWGAVRRRALRVRRGGLRLLDVVELEPVVADLDVVARRDVLL